MKHNDARRQFLKLSGAAGMATVLAPAVAAQEAKRPRDVGRKFYPDGRVMPFAGNTIICHLGQQGENSSAFNALLDIYREMPAAGFARKITMLPPSSYHMTIFGGANDKDRRYPLWPVGLPLDLPIAQCSEILADRLRGFHLGDDAPPYRMRVNLAEPPVSETPLTIRLLSADADTERRLRTLRDRLSKVTGIRDPNHDRYQFHVTLGYQFAAMTDDEVLVFRAALKRWKSELARRVPEIVLGAPEYCVLGDMFAFQRQFYLG